MVRGLYTAASGMLKCQKRMDTLSNNLANVSTVGYKKDIAVYQSFEEMLARRVNDNSISHQIPIMTIGRGTPVGNMRLGADVTEIFTDYSGGIKMHTNKPTDLAINDAADFEGQNPNMPKAFFTVQTADGQEVYTKNGEFKINELGYLTTPDGNYVLCNHDPDPEDPFANRIYIGSDNFSVDGKGNIFGQDNQYIDTLRITQLDNPLILEKMGDNMFRIADGQQLPDPPLEFTGTVSQGYLEGSNVNSVEEMVEMISMYRNYEANQKVIRAYDDALARIINEVGKV